VRTGEKWDALRDVKRKRRAVALERIKKTHVSSVASGSLSQAAFQHLANGGVR
jgi:predicted Fe-Mo cluster-binding NifX family protein